MSSIQFFCKHWGAFSCSLASMFIPTVKPYVPMTPDSMQLNICKISFPFAHFFSLCSHCLDQGPFSSFSENSVHMFICIFHFIIPSHKLAFLNCVFFCTFITQYNTQIIQILKKILLTLFLFMKKYCLPDMSVCQFPARKPLWEA